MQQLTPPRATSLQQQPHTIVSLCIPLQLASLILWRRSMVTILVYTVVILVFTNTRLQLSNISKWLISRVHPAQVAELSTGVVLNRRERGF
jgi:hypothetical protein